MVRKIFLFCKYKYINNLIAIAFSDLWVDCPDYDGYRRTKSSFQGQNHQRYENGRQTMLVAHSLRTGEIAPPQTHVVQGLEVL